MSRQVKAALRILGLSKLPDTEDELKSRYRACVKEAHPDVAGNEAGDKPIKRVYKAYDVLLEALRERDKPKVFVKFGDGDKRTAAVIENPSFKTDVFNGESYCKYMSTIKWFKGLVVKVGNSEWVEVDEIKCFPLNGVFIRCL